MSPYEETFNYKGNWKRRAVAFSLFITSRAAIDRSILVPRNMQFSKLQTHSTSAGISGLV
jgi:hypothetical protein